ncbi:exocyst complex component 8-like [Panonychus citri]|uniref:exocyst complex component 8-like n=1 Tax=Panonychus citri TaxID=50023 RepID=UPI0023076CEF|nr:exocyst complex component 8-like [Panonychus citri]
MFDSLSELPLNKPSVGVEALQQARIKVKNLCEETNALLKKNVYKNYQLFIETSKEISFLKSEMSSLSQLISEEQNLICSLQEMSICGDRTVGSLDDRRLSITGGKPGTPGRMGSSTTSDNSVTFGEKMEQGMSPIGVPFGESELLEEECQADSEMAPTWLIELSEDLDVCIAQRNFEDAVNLVHKFNDHFALYPKFCEDPSQADLKNKINGQIEDLIKAVAKELEIVPDRPMQSGPRAARRAVNLLIRLGRSSMAAELFLAQRSAILRYCLMQQKKEGATLPYIERMSTVFFTNIQESCREFRRAFGLSSTTSAIGTLSSADSISLHNMNDKMTGFSLSLAMACLVSWVKKKLQHYLDSFCGHVFTTQVPPSIASECIAIVNHQCKKLRSNVHLDLVFYCDQRLRPGIEKIINESRDKLLEAIKHRCTNDKWLPQNFGNKPAMSKFLEEMKECSLNLNSYVYDECRLSLTSNTTSFAKSYLHFLRDLVKLSTLFTHKLMVSALVTPFKAHMRHIDKCLRDDAFRNQRKLIVVNANFVLDTLLPMVIQYCNTKFNSVPDEILSLSVRDYC